MASKFMLSSSNNVNIYLNLKFNFFISIFLTPKGGSAYLSEISYISIKNCLFIENTAVVIIKFYKKEKKNKYIQSYGGAIFFGTGIQRSIIELSTFLKNLGKNVISILVIYLVRNIVFTKGWSH